ncbi:MAG: D-alanine--D-alanine ligase [Chitinivibrionales bacterium]|nr:D-alanine--D-alanine ligase [Chitinivibrionales bacterium]
MIQVNVVMGGPSVEHEISLLTGREVLRHLDKQKYRGRAVVVSMNMEFYISCDDAEIPAPETLSGPGKSPVFEGPFPPYSSPAVWDNCDIAFIGLHGSFGEDGIFQGYLDTLKIPYTGSGVFASAVAMNKIASKRIFEQNGLQTPPYSIYGKSNPGSTVESIADERGFPCFVKCPQSGSSRLIGKADTTAELRKLLEQFEHEADDILVESAIEGVELSCPVLEDTTGVPRALPPVEIRPKNSAFFDFDAKYTDNACDEIVPAPQPEGLIKEVKNAALRAHKVLSCACVSRTDMIANDQGLFVLELNSLPGLTPNSLVPKSFAGEGGTYGQMLDIILQRSLNLRKRQ